MKSRSTAKTTQPVKFNEFKIWVLKQNGNPINVFINEVQAIEAYNEEKNYPEMGFSNQNKQITLNQLGVRELIQ